jgi:hypothetical protein
MTLKPSPPPPASACLRCCPLPSCHLQLLTTYAILLWCGVLPLERRVWLSPHSTSTINTALLCRKLIHLFCRESLVNESMINPATATAMLPEKSLGVGLLANKTKEHREGAVFLVGAHLLHKANSSRTRRKERGEATQSPHTAGEDKTHAPPRHRRRRYHPTDTHGWWRLHRTKRSKLETIERGSSA